MLHNCSCFSIGGNGPRVVPRLAPQIQPECQDRVQPRSIRTSPLRNHHTVDQHGASELRVVPTPDLRHPVRFTPHSRFPNLFHSRKAYSLKSCCICTIAKSTHPRRSTTVVCTSRTRCSSLWLPADGPDREHAADRDGLHGAGRERLICLDAAHPRRKSRRRTVSRSVAFRTGCAGRVAAERTDY